MLRRVAVIKVAQRAGIPLAAIRKALRSLPEGRTPSAADWATLSAAWRDELDGRIQRLTRLRNQMDRCIGCGCLSLESCPLRNPWDEFSEQGPGPRLLDPDQGDAPGEGACATQAAQAHRARVPAGWRWEHVLRA